MQQFWLAFKIHLIIRLSFQAHSIWHLGNRKKCHTISLEDAGLDTPLAHGAT